MLRIIGKKSEGIRGVSPEEEKVKANVGRIFITERF